MLFLPPGQHRSGGHAVGDGGRAEGHGRSEEGGGKEGESAETKEASGPPADQLLDKYLQAVGGAAAIDKITSRVMKGTITFGDRNVAIDIFSKDPDKRISFTHTPDGDSVTAFDGHEGWLGIPGHPVREMHGPDIDGAAMDADLHFAAHLKAMFSEVQVRGTEKVGERDAYLVIGQRDGKTPLRAVFRRAVGVAGAAGSVRRDAAGADAHADRLCGLPRGGRGEDSVPLDAGAAERAVHDSG